MYKFLHLKPEQVMCITGLLTRPSCTNHIGTGKDLLIFCRLTLLAVEVWFQGHNVPLESGMCG